VSGDDVAASSDDDGLEKALDRGSVQELPPNRPPGWLGEVAPNLRNPEEYEPSLNAGLLQEDSPQTRWLWLLVLYALVFTGPVALWLLWREPRRSLRAKVTTTLVGAAGYVALYIAAASLPLRG
jgi:hypothetical protein